MQSTSIRTLVGTIALVSAIVVAIVVPAGFFLENYADSASTLAFKARLNANRVAQYIYTHPGLWQYQDVRLVEQIQLPHDDKEIVQQKIFTKDANLVLTAGPPLLAPVMSRSAMIVVSGNTVGSVEVAASLRGALYETGLVALVSSIFGFSIYFAVRLLPLRVLDRTLVALHRAETSLLEQNQRLDVALNNMAQGLCLFDADQRLVIFNRRVTEIFHLPAHTLVPGMPLGQLMELARGADKDPQAALAAQRRFLAEPFAGTAISTLADGRTISISHRPAANGGFVATFEDITERLAAEEKIKHLAHYDALTDLPNRTTFYERTEKVLSQLRRSETLAVFSVDLDRFKSVNDMLGHPIGDLLLKAVAERLRNCVRGEDLVARLGGDEFAIVQVPSPQTADASVLAGRLTETVGAPYELDGHQVIVGASVGIAVAPGDGNKPDVLMKNADLALYRAKADGGGTFRFFEAAMDARVQARRVLELDLRNAIVNGEFELHYQPIVNVKTGQINSCEALVRWHHPQRGLVAPLDFISVAEETGLIVPIGDWVLRQACAEAARWPEHVTISVNLSPAQFKSRSLVQTVINALAAAGLAADRLELEITELVLLQDNEGAFAVLHQLRDLGIRIAMDDFGTGYSSLGYLRSFPFDKIKIDQSFIRDLSTKEDSVAIVRAVVGLSSSLGITTTAEGVETKEQFARLALEGCNEAQGFLFSPPRPAADVEKILAQLAPQFEAVA